MLDLKTEPFGLPYNFHEFQEYCQRMGMEHHITTPEDAQANGFAEAFVKIMVKLVHTAVIEKQDPRKRVNKFLLAFRATPHKVTGRSPAELPYGRKTMTKLPGFRGSRKGSWVKRSERSMRQRGRNRKRMQI